MFRYKFYLREVVVHFLHQDHFQNELILKTIIAIVPN